MLPFIIKLHITITEDRPFGMYFAQGLERDS